MSILNKLKSQINDEKCEERYKAATSLMTVLMHYAGQRPDEVTIHHITSNLKDVGFTAIVFNHNDRSVTVKLDHCKITASYCDLVITNSTCQ